MLCKCPRCQRLVPAHCLCCYPQCCPVLAHISDRLRCPLLAILGVRYVPFYGTQLVSQLGGEGSCKPNWTEAAAAELVAQFWADAPRLLPTLGSKPHWMQLSEIEWMIHGGCGEGWGIPLACHPLASHVIFATPEALTKLHPTAWRQRFHGHKPANNNSIAIPYLGHVHRVSTEKRAQQLADEAVASQKQYLASMSFGSMRGAWLRMNLTEQCQAAPDECWYLHYDARGYADIIEAYRRAWFCVQPYGDTPTRSALLDCLASGLAVPAVFDKYLFDMLPFADVVDYRAMLAYVPEERVMPPDGNLLWHLRAFSTEERAAMLLNVQRASHAFQYAVSVPCVHSMAEPVAHRIKSPKRLLRTTCCAAAATVMHAFFCLVVLSYVPAPWGICHCRL